MRQIRIQHNVKKRAAEITILVSVILCVFVLLFSIGRTAGRWNETVRETNMTNQCFERFTAGIWKHSYPAYESYEDTKTETWANENSSAFFMKFILKQVPYYRNMKGEIKKGNRRDLDPSYKNYIESHEVFREYEYLVRGLSNSAILASGKNPLAAEHENVGNEKAGESSQEIKTANSAEQIESITGSSAAASGKQYIVEQLADYDFLMKHFYTVHPTTTAGRDMMKAETFLAQDLSLDKSDKGPQILIYHTHSQEEFSDYNEGNKEATIVGVGTYLTELLEKKGYRVIHDTSVYDLHNGKLDRSKAYTYALDGITGIMQKYPSIQVVLDVHRDGVKKGTHLVETINGKPTAPIMFFNGTSQTPSGPIEYLKNPYRTENLAFSFQMKLCADAHYPKFTRKIYLKGLRYNMHLRPRSALIEVGAQTNTYEEARNAMEPLSELLDMVLREK